jgi:hypothetical protein
VLIPYKYLVPLLIFTLLIGVVIGDRLAAEQWNGNGNGNGGDGRSGSCAGLASSRLHACVHRYGSWRAPQERARTGGGAGCPDCWPNGGRDSCGYEGAQNGHD